MKVKSETEVAQLCPSLSDPVDCRPPGSFVGNQCSPVAQMVKNPPAMWETWVRPLGREDPLEEGMAIYSSILAWIIPWTEEPGRLQGVAESWTRLSD